MDGVKEKLNGLPTEVLFKEREIWWIAVGRNVGEESNGKGNRFSRPVIVFKNSPTTLFMESL